MSLCPNVHDTKSNYLEETRTEQRKERMRQMRFKSRQLMKLLELKDQSLNEITLHNLLSSLHSYKTQNSLRPLLAYSQEQKYCSELLRHTGILFDFLEGANEEQKTNLLGALANLSEYDDFEMPEDTGTVTTLLDCIHVDPNSVLRILSNHMNKEQSCPNVIFHIAQSNLLEHIGEAVQSGAEEHRASITLFLCALGRSRPLLEMSTLRQVNRMIRDLFQGATQATIVEEVVCYLSDHYNLKDNEALAESLYYDFQNVLKRSEIDLSEIIFYIHYLARHQNMQPVLANDSTLIDIITTLVTQSKNKRVALEVIKFLINNERNVSFDVVTQKLFDGILASYSKMKQAEQVLSLEIVSKHVIESLEDDTQTKIGYEVQKLIEECLKAESEEIVNMSVELLIAIAQLTGNTALIFKYAHILEAVQLYSNLSQDTFRNIEYALCVRSRNYQN